MLDFDETIDTTEATTDADDAELNASCGAPSTDASVWYEVVPDTDGVLVVDVSQSSYTAGAFVATGEPGSFELLACGPAVVSVAVATGVPYHVVAFDDQDDAEGNGGELNISMSLSSLPVIDELTIDPVGTFSSQTGKAHITGTYTCSDADFIELYPYARQYVGRLNIIEGWSFYRAEDTCDGTPHTWSADLTPYGGRFAGGKAVVTLDAFVCARFCNSLSIEAVVHLKGSN